MRAKALPTTDSPTPPPTTVSSIASSCRAGVRVLLAGGDAESRQSRERQLLRAGAFVSAARTAFEAIVKASCQLPDMILLDDSLDDMAAAEAGRLITTCPATAHIPVVCVAAGRPLPRRVLTIVRRAGDENASAGPETMSPV